MRHKIFDEFVAANKDRKIEHPCQWGMKDDPRQEMWAKEREEYGFDERETWNLDTSFVVWVYERVKRYYEISPVDLEFHKFEIGEKEYTQRECIEHILINCEKYFISGEWDEKAYAEICKFWSAVSPAMWW